MAIVKPILSDEDFRCALERIYELFHAEPGSPEGAELEALCQLVEAHDDEHHPIPDPTPPMAIRGRMDNLELAPDDLVPIIGSREAVEAMLAGQCAITPAMAEALSQLLGIDAAVLLQKPAEEPVTE